MTIGHNNPELLRAIMDYDHETGALIWRCRPVSMFGTRRACSVWNARYAGKPALDCDDGRGYRIEDASAARRNAELEFGYHKNHGRNAA